MLEGEQLSSSCSFPTPVLSVVPQALPGMTPERNHVVRLKHYWVWTLISNQIKRQEKPESREHRPFSATQQPAWALGSTGTVRGCPPPPPKSACITESCFAGCPFPGKGVNFC